MEKNTKKTNTTSKKEKKQNTVISDTKKYFSTNKIKLLIVLIAFPFGFFFALQNRKSYLVAIIYLLSTTLSIVLYFTIYNFLYFYS